MTYPRRALLPALYGNLSYSIHIRNKTQHASIFSLVSRLQPPDALLEPGLAAGLALQQSEPRVAARAPQRRRPEAPHPRVHAQPQQAGPRRQGRRRAGRAGAGRTRRRQEGLRVGNQGARGGRGRVWLRPLQTAHVLGSEAAAAAAAAPRAREPGAAADAAASEGLQHAEGGRRQEDAGGKTSILLHWEVLTFYTSLVTTTNNIRKRTIKCHAKVSFPVYNPVRLVCNYINVNSNFSTRRVTDSSSRVTQVPPPPPLQQRARPPARA